MTQMQAVDIAEGLVEAKDDKEYLAAWQCLIDTGLVWSLQGRFGRAAAQLIRDGYCTPPASE